MSRSVREFTVFVASPGDLPDEREAVRRATEYISEGLSAVSPITFRAVGWEQVAPEMGRPQEIINPRVRDCDVFIGLMYRRWGTPTGTHSSGFEEEFSIASDRRREGDSPRIAMFFKAIPNDYLQDPGRDLARVLKFKSRLQKSKTLLYQEFNNEEGLELQVTRYLQGIVADEIQSNVLSGTSSTQSGADLHLDADLSVTSEVGEGRQQLASVLHAFYELVSGHTYETASLDGDRLTIVGASLSKDFIALPTHLVNRVYIRRESLRLSYPEIEHWLRTMLTDIANAGGWASRVVPGWGILLSGCSPADEGDRWKTIEDALVEAILAASEASVAAGAVHVLNAAKIYPSSLFSAASLSGGAPGTEEQAVVAWVKVLKRSDPYDIEFDYLMSGLRQQNDAGSKFVQALQQAGLDNDSRLAIENIQSAWSGDASNLASFVAKQTYRVPPSWIRDLVTSRLSALNLEALGGLARAPKMSFALRLAALKLVQESGGLTVDVANSFLSVKSSREMRMFVEFLRSDQALMLSFSPHWVSRIESKDAIADELQARLMELIIPVDDLRSSAARSVLPLSASLALMFSSDPESLRETRELLDTDGEDFRLRYRTEVGDRGQNDRVAEYLLDQLKVAAVSTLCRLPEESADSDDGRRIVDALSSIQNPWLLTPDSVADLESRFETLIPSIVTSMPGVRAAEWAAVIPRWFEKFGPSVAEPFLSDTRDEIRAAACAFLSESGSLTEEQLTELLYDDDPTVRMNSCLSLVKRLSREDLIELIEKYASTPDRTHYYNVLAMIDEALYAPFGLSIETFAGSADTRALSQG